MGLLSDILDPRKRFEHTKRGVSSLASGDIRGALDPGGFLGGKTMSAPKADPMAMDEFAVDPSMYMGDEGDAAYGSMTDPFDVEDFYAQQDPGYAFELQQGQQALLNSAAAGSGSMSGAALKDLIGYSQGFARTGYNDAFNRHQVQQGNIFGRLRDIAGLGQNAAAGVGSVGTSLAGNAGQMYSNAGSAAGAGIVGAGNALGQGATNYWLMRQFNQPGKVAASPGSV